MCGHSMISWGIHPDGFATRCSEFLHDVPESVSSVDCVSCLRQLVADLMEELEVQRTRSEDLAVLVDVMGEQIDSLRESLR